MILVDTCELSGIHSLYANFISCLISAQVARRIFECKRREAAALIIQKDARMFFKRKAHVTLRYSAVVIQSGMRGMTARNALIFLRRNKAATIIQVFHVHPLVLFKWPAEKR